MLRQRARDGMIRALEGPPRRSGRAGAGENVKMIGMTLDGRKAGLIGALALTAAALAG